MLRILLETSITRFARSGLGVYAANLAPALAQAEQEIRIVNSAVPRSFGSAPHPLIQKLYAAYWQIVHARVVVPRQARLLGCDLVHYTMTMPVPAGMPCPVVATVHDLIPFTHPEWVQPVRGARMRHGIELAVARCDHLITDSEATRRDVLARFSRPAATVTTVLLAGNSQLPVVDGEQARTLIERCFTLSAGYVLCVGSIEPRKNLERVIAAYAELKRRSVSVPKLVIVGGSVWRHQSLHDQIARLGVVDDVVLTGHVPADQLAALFRCAGVFVYPSLYEGFGLPPLEAMRLGCPVVTSDRSSLPEVVGAAALTVDPYDTQQISAAIARVLADAGLAAELRRRGLARAAEFSWQRCAQETIAVYHSVLSRP